MRSDCSARRRRSPTQTTPLLPPPPSPSPPAPPPLPLPSPPPPPPPSQSVGLSRVVGAAFTIAVRVRAPARPSFQVVEVELVAHLPTEWKKKRKKRGRGEQQGLRGRSLSSLFQGKKLSDERTFGKINEESHIPALLRVKSYE